MTPSRPAKEELIKLLKEKAYIRREELFQLSSGGWSHDYVDCRSAMAKGSDLGIVALAVVEAAASCGIPLLEEYWDGDVGPVDAIGGLTMGADPISHAVSMATGISWFSVRKSTKEHGAKKAIEGAHIEEGTKVIVVDDVVTTGGSIIDAVEALSNAGADIVLSIALLDRGYSTRKAMEVLQIEYSPVATFEDLGIEPIGIN